MHDFWVYTLMGFFGGMIFCFLLMIGFIKSIIKIGISRGDKDE